MNRRGQNRTGEDRPEPAGTASPRQTRDAVKDTRLALTLPPDAIDDKAWEQIENVLSLDCLVRLAIMPDVHAGYDLCIGGVALLEGTISPGFVGYDIGCGMCHVNTGRTVDELLPDALSRQRLFDRILHDIPVGTDMRGPGEFDAPRFLSASGDKGLTTSVVAKAARQMATLGGGNHFIEVGVNSRSEVGITLHSGSRRPGWDIAAWYMRQGRLFALRTPMGQAYLKDMQWAQEYALANRRAMLALVLKAFPSLDEATISHLLASTINENHNHAEVDGANVLHRKGATPAASGQPGIIPANQRDGVYITRGLGNAYYLSSASHGAGRVMSRQKARAHIEQKTFERQMHGILCRTDKGVLDEAPDAYKPIAPVLAAQDGLLVDVVDHFRPVVVIKG